MAYAPNPHRKVRAKTRALSCSFTGCRKTTTSPTGRCFHHRAERPAGSPAAAFLPAPEPTAVSGWVSGRGIPHPTGDYDTVKKAGGKTIYTRADAYHRLDGPAIVEARPSDTSFEHYFVRGQRHRDDGPAVVAHSPDGSLFMAKWYVEDVVHREDGPAEIWFRKDGTVQTESYRSHGKNHRLDGPAVAYYDEDGSLRGDSEFLVEDEEYTAEEFGRLREALDGGAPFEWAKSYALGSGQ